MARLYSFTAMLTVLSLLLLGIAPMVSAESDRNLGFVDSLFGVHMMDGGSTILDYVVIPCGLIVCGLHLSMVWVMLARTKVRVPYHILCCHEGGVVYVVIEVTRIGRYWRVIVV